MMATTEGGETASKARGPVPSVGGSGNTTGSKYIGVADDYVRPGKTTYEHPANPMRRVAPGVIRGQHVTATVAKRPQYNQAWLDAQLAGMSPEDVWMYQQKMARAGFIGPKTRVRRGIWDDTTRNAFKNLVEMANIYTTDIDSALALASQDGGLGGLINPLTGEEYDPEGGGSKAEERKPFTGKKTRKDTSVDLTDPQQARVRLRRALREELGRAPSNAEIAQVVGALNAAEQKNPRVSTTVAEYKEDELVGTSTQSSGGVDAEAFLDEQLRSGQFGKERASFMRDTDYYDAAMSVLGEGGGRL